MLRDYEWTVAVDETLWDERYDFVWNMTFSPDGRDIAVNIKKDNEFGISLNGRPFWNLLVFVVSFFRILLTNPNWDIRKFFHLSVAHGIVSIEANFGS